MREKDDTAVECTPLVYPSLQLQTEKSMHSLQNSSTICVRAAGIKQLGLPVHAILLGASAEQAQDPPVMVWGGRVVSQADQVVVALLLAALQAVLQAVEARPWPHARAAARLALPLLHPVYITKRLDCYVYEYRCSSPVMSDEPK